MTLDIREFHTHFIAIQDVPNHDKWKQHFVTAIDNEVSEKDKAVMPNVDKWENRNNSITSYFYDHSTVDYGDFTEQVVKPVVNKVLKSLDFNYFPVQDVFYWYNRYDQMGTHEIHHHPDCDLCLIYLLHLEEPNTTVFHNTMYTQKYFQREMYTEDLTEGKIIIFPSHLKHEVQWSDYKRYTIAGNINLDYEPKISQSD